MTPAPRRAILAAAGTLLASRAARAQAAWPNRPLRCLVGAGPGGTTDIVARLLAPSLSARLGQPVLVENRPGGGGTVAGEALVRARDNHTMMMLNNGHAASAAVFRRLPYDAVESFAPVSGVATMALILLAPPNGPHATLPALIEAARAAPGTLNLGMVGVGTTQHFVAEAFQAATGTRFTAIPYRTTGDALIALRSNDVAVVVETVGAVLGQVQAGEAVPLAVSTAARVPRLPAVPTVAEAAKLPDFGLPTWYALALPASAPAEAVGRLHDAILASLAESDLRRRLDELGLVPAGSDPHATRDMIAREVSRARAIVASANIPRE